MALTVSRVGRPMKVGNRKQIVSEITWDNSYASEGEKVTQKELGFRRVDRVECFLTAGSESSTLRPTNAYYTPSTEKFHLIDSATGKEIESTKDMSKVKMLAVVTGV